MRILAVTYQVFEITHSTFAVGLIGVVEVVPLILFSIWGGAFADRMDRKKIVVATQIGLIAASAALAWVSFGPGHPSVLMIYAISAVSSSLGAIDRPARSSMMPNLVPREQISAALALRQVNFQITMIVGPMIGGVLIEATGEVAWVYVLDAVTFLASIASLWWVPSLPIADQGEVSSLAAVREGLRYSFKTPLILSVFVSDLVAMIFGMPRALFPALAENTFHMGAGGVGLLFAAPSVGALVGALTTGWVTKVVRQGRAVLVSITAWGAAITLAGLCLWSLPLTLFFLAVAGAADVVSAVFRGTILQHSTPNALLGRANAVNLMVVAGGPRIGDFEAGALAAVVGAPASVVIGGVACLVGIGAVAGLFPSMRDYRSGQSPIEISEIPPELSGPPPRQTTVLGSEE
jgi:MFS family permease